MPSKNRKQHRSTTSDIPPVDFNPRQFTDKATIPANVYASFSSRAENLTDFLRHANRLLETHKDFVVDSIRKQARIMMNTDFSDEDTEEIKEVLTWSSHEEFVAELILSRLSENYLIYLTDLANHIFRTKPETMKSEKTETHEFILGHSSMIELVSVMADKQAEKLVTFQQIKDCYRKTFGMPLYTSQKDADLADEIIGIRNVIVHNQGMIDEQFMRRFPRYAKLACIAVDDDVAFVRIGLHHLKRYGVFLAKSVADIDRRAAAKFGLPTLYMSGITPPEDSGADE